MDRKHALASRLWQVAQGLGVVLTVALLAGLVMRPEFTLNLLWNLVVPLLPATFLLTPAIWRNACPLATLNMLPNRFGLRRTLAAERVPAAGAIAVLLLVVLVPARRFLFNTDGVALAATIAAVGLGAVVLGLVFDAKAGFCGSICPVLPVERLYGQSPLLSTRHERCSSCTSCTGTSCIDLAPTRLAPHLTGAEVRSTRWLGTVFGAFAASFPGFVIGYNTVSDTELANAGAVYGNVALWSAGSLLLFGGAFLLLQVGARRGLPLLGAAAVAAYYWFAGPVLAEAALLPDTAGNAIRVLAFALVVVWLWRALLRAQQPSSMAPVAIS